MHTTEQLDANVALCARSVMITAAGTLPDFDADARVGQVFPPTGKRFAATHSHWFRGAGANRAYVSAMPSVVHSRARRWIGTPRSRVDGRYAAASSYP